GESAPASADFTMEDWFTPRPVPQVNAELRGNDVVVSWITFADPAIQYRVYRIDNEDPAQRPELVTQQPTAGTPMVQPATPKQAQAMTAATARFQASAARSIQQRGLLDALRMDKVMVKIPPPKIFTLPQPPPWVTFTDVNAPKDHYYRYVVTAIFTRNNRDSAASPSSLVAI